MAIFKFLCVTYHLELKSFQGRFVLQRCHRKYVRVRTVLLLIEFKISSIAVPEDAEAGFLNYFCLVQIHMKFIPVRHSNKHDFRCVFESASRSYMPGSRIWRHECMRVH